eukprot:3410795-Alexandrium_andersonii.AAC.1
MAVDSIPGADRRRGGASRPWEFEQLGGAARPRMPADVLILTNPDLISVRRGGGAPSSRAQGTKKVRVRAVEEAAPAHEDREKKD